MRRRVLSGYRIGFIAGPVIHAAEHFPRKHIIGSSFGLGPKAPRAACKRQHFMSHLGAGDGTYRPHFLCIEKKLLTIKLCYICQIVGPP